MKNLNMTENRQALLEAVAVGLNTATLIARGLDRPRSSVYQNLRTLAKYGYLLEEWSRETVRFKITTKGYQALEEVR